MASVDMSLWLSLLEIGRPSVRSETAPDGKELREDVVDSGLPVMATDGLAAKPLMARCGSTPAGRPGYC